MFATIIGFILFFLPCLYIGQVRVLEKLCKIHPENRNEAIRRWCRICDVPMNYVEDLEDEYNDEYEYQDEKAVLIEVA